ncbi:MAG: ion channel [Candidatus Cloacimonadota bacterium]
MKLLRRFRRAKFLHHFGGLGLLNADNRKLITRFFLVLIIIVILLLVSSYLVWHFEGRSRPNPSIKSFGDGLWWAIVTIATVGYGDVVPQSSSGRMVGYVLIVFGFVLLSVFTGLIASLLVEDKIKGAKGLKQIKTHNHIVICGWNKTASALLTALQEKQPGSLEICLVMNQSTELFESLESQFNTLQLRFVRGEPSQEDVLRRASISTASQVIVLADQSLDRQIADDRSIIIANILQYLISKERITVQLLNPDNRSLLLRSGIRDILIFDDLGGYLLANNILDSSSLCIFSQLLKSKDQHLYTGEIPESFVGKAYKELFDHFSRSGSGLMIGLISKEPVLELDSIFSDNSSAIDQFIKSTLAKSSVSKTENRENIRWNPSPDSLIQADDLAIILGAN